MNARDDRSGGDYTVGRGKPPREHCFRPGFSGNLRGRPKKSDKSSRHPLEQAAENIFLREAHREVTLNDGGKSVTMTALEAATRAHFNKAIRGNAHAQKSCIQIAQAIERKETEQHAKLWEQAIVRKAELEVERQHWVASGRDEAAMLFHPEDIQICSQTGDVTTYLALTEEERDARQRLLLMRGEKEAVIRRNRKARELGVELQLWALELELAEETFNVINEALPPRFRKQLK